MEKQQLASKQQMTSRGKLLKLELRSFNWRFPSPAAIFDGAIRLETTSRWIFGTLPSFLPFPKKRLCMRKWHPPAIAYGAMTVQMHNHSKNYWNRFLITMFLCSDSTGAFLRVSLRAPLANLSEAVFFMIIIYKLW